MFREVFKRTSSQRGSLLRQLVSSLETARDINTLTNEIRLYHTTPHNSPNWNHITTIAALALVTAPTTALLSDSNTNTNTDSSSTFVGIDNRRRMFFKYEKRLREYSTPEKVYEYFATNRQGLFMTASDMLRSVTSLYPPVDSDIIRGGNLPGEPLPCVHHEPSDFFKLFDVDANGVIGFDEFLLFRTLLSMPLAYAEASFTCIDENANGSIDKEEFSRLLEALDDRSKRPMSPSLRKSSTGSLREARAGLLELFFGKGQKTLSLKTFLKFLQDFRAELVRLEYCFYDYNKKGYITGRDFAYSVVGPVRLKHMDGYLDKVQDMPEDLATSKVTFKDFQVFRQVWEQLPALTVALDFWQGVHGNVYAEDFRKIVKRVLHCDLPQVQVDILFYLFGDGGGGGVSSNGNGGHGQALNINFLFQVLNRHYCVTGLTSSHSLAGKKHGQEERGFLECVTSCMRQGQN